MKRGGVPVRWVLAMLVSVCGLLTAGVAAAQAADSGAVPTFHAYTNLVQVPTLVLGQDRKPLAPIDERRFYVSLDSGPKFRVTHARVEGEDALSVVILLDLSQTDAKILAGADEAIASLAPLSLHAKDEVAIYAMDCKLIHVMGDGATDSATLKRHVDLVLEGSKPRNPRAAKCENPANLWESISSLVQMLSTHSGRRVILAVTDGVDRGSHTTPFELMQMAQIKSVAIFGFADPMESMVIARGQKEPPLSGVCESSGGMVLETPAKDLGKQLAWAVKLIRGRYIVEFPRPMTSEGGMHNLDITIAKSDAFIRPAGASFPTPDPAVLKDPTTIQSDPENAPKLGSRRVLQPK